MQREKFDISRAPIPPLRAEPKPGMMPRQDGPTDGHVRGVEATSGGLIRATLGAAAAAGAVLVLLWLPAEYGIDPTGVGGALGLTEMGDIKQQRYAEAAAEDAALAAGAGSGVPSPAPSDVTGRLDAIEQQLAAIAAVVGADVLARSPVPSAPDAEAPAITAAPAAPAPVEEVASAAPATAEASAAAGWRDEVSYTLSPGEGIEVKLAMEEGATAEFEWTANGAVLNYDTHGDGGGQKVSYEQGRGVPDQAGEPRPSGCGTCRKAPAPRRRRGGPGC